jgi:hypothetical protein
MAMTGQQFFPGASTAYRYDSAYPGARMEINCCVTHTTEGTSLPSYGGGASAPNVTLVPDFNRKRLVVYGHFPADMSARALVDRAGGPTTNRNNCHQVELVGTCDPATHRKWEAANRLHIYWPEAPEWALRDYARYVAWLYTEHGVPLTLTKRPWLPYPQSYGSANGQRMTSTEWATFTGHCGHQHVPEGNDHGDPGNMRMDLVIAYARALVDGLNTPPPEEEDMTPEQDALLKKVASQANALYSERRYYSWGYENTNVDPRDTYGILTDIDKRLQTFEGVELTDAQVATLADKVASSPSLANRIAELVAEKLAARLAQ